MNPGPAEEVGKAANTFMDVMKSQPIALALVVMNVLLLGYLFWNEQKYVDARRDFAEKLFAQQTHETSLLAHCILPEDFIKILQAQGIIPQPK